MLNLPWEERIVVPFNFVDQVGEAQGLYTGLCGLLAGDCSLFPIGFDKWPNMPQSYFNNFFYTIIKVISIFLQLYLSTLYLNVKDKPISFYF